MWSTFCHWSLSPSRAPISKKPVTMSMDSDSAQVAVVDDEKLAAGLGGFLGHCAFAEALAPGAGGTRLLTKRVLSLSPTGCAGLRWTPSPAGQRFPPLASKAAVRTLHIDWIVPCIPCAGRMGTIRGPSIRSRAGRRMAIRDGQLGVTNARSPTSVGGRGGSARRPLPAKSWARPSTTPIPAARGNCRLYERGKRRGSPAISPMPDFVPDTGFFHRIGHARALPEARAFPDARGGKNVRCRKVQQLALDDVAHHLRRRFLVVQYLVDEEDGARLSSLDTGERSFHHEVEGQHALYCAEVLLVDRREHVGHREGQEVRAGMSYGCGPLVLNPSLPLADRSWIRAAALALPEIHMRRVRRRHLLGGGDGRVLLAVGSGFPWAGSFLLRPCHHFSPIPETAVVECP